MEDDDPEPTQSTTWSRLGSGIKWLGEVASPATPTETPEINYKPDTKNYNAEDKDESRFSFFTNVPQFLPNIWPLFSSDDDEPQNEVVSEPMDAFSFLSSISRLTECITSTAFNGLASSPPVESALKPREVEISLNELHEKIAECQSFAQIDGILQVFLRAAKFDIEIQEETVSLFIKACCRSKAASPCLQILRDDVFNLKPSRKGWHHLMVKLSLCGVLDDVELCFETMSEAMLPTSQSYHILIRACVDNSDIRKAFHYLQQCRARKIDLERGTFNVVINGCRGFTSPFACSLTLELVEMMRVDGIVPSNGTFVLVATHCTEAQRPIEALDALHSLVLRSRSIKKPVSTTVQPSLLRKLEDLCRLHPNSDKLLLRLRALKQSLFCLGLIMV